MLRAGQVQPKDLSKAQRDRLLRPVLLASQKTAVYMSAHSTRRTFDALTAFRAMVAGKREFDPCGLATLVADAEWERKWRGL